MRSFVTGGLGFVGRHLSSLLQREGPVFGYDLEARGDVLDYEHLRLTLERTQPTHVFHLAALASPPESLADPRGGVDTNVLGTLNLLEAVRHTFGPDDQPRVLVVGSSEEYGWTSQGARIITEDSPLRPTQPYGVTKLAASLLGLTYASNYGLRVVVTRAWNHAGPGAPTKYVVGSLAKKVVDVECGRADMVLHGNLKTWRNLGDVRDVVRAYRLAVEQPSGSVFNVCSDETVTVGDVLDILGEHARCPVLCRVDAELYREEPADHPTPSHERLTAETGWRPEVPLERTLVDTLAWYRARSEL